MEKKFSTSKKYRRHFSSSRYVKMPGSSQNDDRNNYRLNLISLVKANPILWDKTSEDFTNRTAKVDKWLELSKMLGVSTDKIRRTWENLRDQYRRDLKRQLAYGSKSKWRLYDEMNFIRKMVRIKEASAGNSESDDDNVVVTAEEAQNQLAVEHIASMLQANLEASHVMPVMDANENLWLTDEMAAQNYQQQAANAAEEQHQQQQQQPYQQQQRATCVYNNETNLELNTPDMVKIEIGSNPESPAAPLTQNASASHKMACRISEPYVSTSCTSDALPKRFNREQAATNDDPNENKRFGGTANHSADYSQLQDEDYHFVMSILPSLRQIESKRKLFLRMGIMNLVSQELQREQH